MIRYKVSHTTTYDYDSAVAVCQNIVYLTPRVTPNQTCPYHRLTVRPVPTSPHKGHDYFGNAVATFSLSTGHRRLQITAHSKVELQDRTLPDPATSTPWENVRDALPKDRSLRGLANYQFCFPSPRIPKHLGLAEYGKASFVPGRPMVEALRELMQRVHADFKYDPQATTVRTSITEVFEKRRGVCQDLAHVMIGALRPLGIAARYVSGYLRTHVAPGQTRLVGADASHAWLAVFCGPHGWIDVDPTNDVFPSVEHITVAWGRDFGDVCPVAGMFVGGGSHRLAVAVDVVPLDEAE